ncbi:MAG: AAA family ATPase [Thermoguttaceae bacterium]|nr:AAA family ATPase [Thermoguttaceae bacterium]
MKNPYKNMPVIGRDEEIDRIMNRLKVGGSIGICGLRHIGKSSIAEQVLNNLENDKTNSFTCAEISIGTISDEKNLYDEIADALFPSEEELFNSSDSATQLYLKLKRTLRKQAKEGFRGIVVLKELDAIRKIEKADVIVNRIRDLVENYEKYGLSFLFLSARSLLCIQENTKDLSTLEGICETLDIKPLSRQSIQKMMEMGNLYSEEALNGVMEITGGHPYLAQILLKNTFDDVEKTGKEVTIETLKRMRTNCASVFDDYYKSLHTFFKTWDTSCNLWDSLCDYLVGPCLEEPKKEYIQYFRRYGIVSDETGLCFSNDFFDYLSLSRIKPVWDEIASLELKLRTIIADALFREYQEKWPETLKKEHEEEYNEMKKIKALTMKGKAKQKGGDFDILEFSFLRFLLTIILDHKELFQSIFSQIREELFKDWMGKICDVRNEICHNRRPEYVNKERQAAARDCCKELLKHL